MVTDNLELALLALNDNGQHTPCADRDEWTSERRADREQAAAMCHACPIITTCHAAAVNEGHKFGVWAGVDRGDRKPRRTKP